MTRVCGGERSESGCLRSTASPPHARRTEANFVCYAASPVRCVSLRQGSGKAAVHLAG